MHASLSWSTKPISVCKMQEVGQTAIHVASVQCIQLTATALSSPGTPSLIVTTRRLSMPQGTSCSFLQTLAQAMHSMQRSESQRNFIRAICPSSRFLDAADGDLGLLHLRHGIIAIGVDGVGDRKSVV